MTAEERRGASILLLVLAGTVGLRAGLADRPRVGGFEADPDVTDSLLAASAAALEESDRRSRPLAPAETLDPNRAAAWELDRLPGVGPAMAEAIVEERGSGGAFRSVEDLARVTGIGLATVERLRPHLGIGSGGEGGRPVLGAGPEERGPIARSGWSTGNVDLNRASSTELQSIPGIGPALARRILDFRRSGGAFRSPSDLERVRGIGPETAARIWAHATGKSNS